jgi:hypothetical protein
VTCVFLIWVLCSILFFACCSSLLIFWVPEDEGFDLIPRAVDSTWKLHAAWLTAPAEKLDMGEIDALLAASGAPLPMRPAF